MASFIKFIGIIAAILGIVQGIVWTCLAIISVLIHFDVWKFELDLTTYSDNVNNALVSLIKGGNATLKEGDLLISSDTLAIWLYFYIGSSVVWTAISVFLLVDLAKIKLGSYHVPCVLWSLCTWLVSLSDVALTALLILDCVNITKEIDKAIQLQFELLARSIAATIAARGFSLLVINMAVSVMLIVAQKNKLSNSPQADLSTYDSISISRDMVGRPNSMYVRSNSFNATVPYQQNIPRLAPVQANPTPAERWAHMNTTASGRRSPSPEQSYLYPNNYKVRPEVPPKPTQKNRPHYIYGEKY